MSKNNNFYAFRSSYESLYPLLNLFSDLDEIAIMDGVSCGSWFLEGGLDKDCPWVSPINRCFGGNTLLEVYRWSTVQSCLHQLSDTFPVCILGFSKEMPLSRDKIVLPKLVFASDESYCGFWVDASVDNAVFLQTIESTLITDEEIKQSASQVFQFGESTEKWLSGFVKLPFLPPNARS